MGTMKLYMAVGVTVFALAFPVYADQASAQAAYASASAKQDEAMDAGGTADYALNSMTYWKNLSTQLRNQNDAVLTQAQKDAWAAKSHEAGTFMVAGDQAYANAEANFEQGAIKMATASAQLQAGNWMQAQMAANQAEQFFSTAKTQWNNAEGYYDTASTMFSEACLIASGI